MAMRFLLGGSDMGTSVVRLGQIPGFIGNAEMGEAGICGLPFDDPTGSLVITGWQTFTVDESAGPAGQQRLWTGFIADRQYARATGTSLIAAASRRIETTLVDLNTILTFRLFPESDSTANRPSETDVARINWLLSTSYLSSVYDLGFVNSTGPVTLDAADLRGQSALSLLGDCGDASGKNYFLYYDESANKIGLWYDFDYSTNFTSTLSLSNVLSDVDNVTTFAYEPDATLDVDPGRVYSGVQVPYSGTGSPVYVTRAATTTAFGVARDTTAPNVNVKTSGAATTLGRRYLNSIATEDQKIKLTVRLPASKVTLLREGMRVAFKASHFPYGLSSYTYCRILNREAKQDEQSDQFYNVVLELSPPVTPAASQHILIAFMAQNFPLGTTPVAPTDLSAHSWTQLFWSNDFCDPNTVGSGAGPPVRQCFGLYYRAILSSETTTVATFQPPGSGETGMFVYEIAGCDIDAMTTVSTRSVHLADAGTSTLTTSASGSSVLFGGTAFGKVEFDGGWGNPPGWLPPNQLVNNSAGTEVLNCSVEGNTDQQAPWLHIGYATGTGTLTVSCVANSHGGGASAYTGGYNTSIAGFLIPILTSFSIVQSANNFGSGASFNVVMPSPPTPS